MYDNKKFYSMLAVYFAALLLTAYWVPVFETTDARYAEISREMIASGNFFEPFYNGIKHFHKPPFTYWINALGMLIFGENGFGARFFGAVASIIILIYTRKTALLLTGDKKKADISVLVLASSFLFLIVGRIVATDIYVVMFTIMSLYHIFDQIYLRRSMRNALFIGLYSGLGFLAKGPVIFLFTLLPYVTAMFFSREHRRGFTLAQILAMLAVFVAVALPWYIYVVSINDGLLQYFLYDQTVERVASNKFDRAKPFYFYFAIFFGTFLPWAFFMFRNLKLTPYLKTGRITFLYILMPFLVFQITTSKLGTYLLPFFPMAAIIVAMDTKSLFLRRVGYLVTALTGAALMVLPFVLAYVKPYWYLTLPAGFMIIMATLYLYKNKLKSGYEFSFTALVVVIFVVAYALIPLFGPYIKGYRHLAEDIKSFDPKGEYPILIYRTFTPSISFYMNKVVAIAEARERETQFQKYEDYKDTYIENNDELMRFLSDKPELVLVARKKEAYETFMRDTGYKCEVISIRGGKKYVAFCKSPDSVK